MSGIGLLLSALAMPLFAGSRIGSYGVIAALGAGVMSACGRSERVQRVELQRVGVGPAREERS